MPKLVRDNIDQEFEDEVIELDNPDDFRQPLMEKLLEEIIEYIKAPNKKAMIEEAADIREVLLIIEREDIIRTRGLLDDLKQMFLLYVDCDVPLHEVEIARIKKLEKRGGFNRMLYWYQD